MTEFYEATFTWPAGPSDVVVTGTFDDWGASTKLTKTWEGPFSGTVLLPWGAKVLYKYIVDGKWTTSVQEQTERDGESNVNNVFYVPTKSGSVTTTSYVPEPSTVVAPVKKVAEEIADSVLAAQGTSSVTEYLATAIGGAIQAVTGVDPISPPKLAIDSPEAQTILRSSSPGIDLTPAADHGKVEHVSQVVHEKLPSLLPAAADAPVKEDAKAATELPSLLPAASEISKAAKEPTPEPVALAAPATIVPAETAPAKTEATASETKAIAAAAVPAPVAPASTVLAPAAIVTETTAVKSAPSNEAPATASSTEPLKVSTDAGTAVEAPAKSASVPNGESAANVVAEPTSNSTSTTKTAPPSTPKYEKEVSFPNQSPIDSSPKSPIRSDSVRKKRQSIFGKVKGILFASPQKEKEKELAKK